MSETPFTRTEHLDGRVVLYGGDNRDVLKSLPDNSVDSIATDPPYALVSIVKRFGGANAAPVNNAGTKAGNKGDPYARSAGGFMGKKWDTGEVAFSEVFWAECLRVLKPGGHVVAFSGTRTYHRMAVAIEDAGFEIRDQLAWAYGSGFPKSHDVSKGIDKAAGAERAKIATPMGPTGNKYKKGLGDDRPWMKEAAEKGYHEHDSSEPITEAAREWQGWGTALKPSWEPICLARKPLAVDGRPATVAANVLAHGTGALNIDGCRVGADGGTKTVAGDRKNVTVHAFGDGLGAQGGSIAPIDAGRWPANIVHDGSEEVLAAFPETGAAKVGMRGEQHSGRHGGLADIGGNIKDGTDTLRGHNDNGGSAARFFYTAKADKLDRMASKHPTVKPVDLMQWLVRLITPPGGVVLDPFAGSGSTGEAAWREGMQCILIEREAEYQADIATRLELANAGPATRRSKAIKQVTSAGPLFGDNDNEPTGGGQTNLRQVR